ncbi:hypothetical protein GQ55_2G436600 [Panicum hallii var. hallii]|uniref:Uncharacterized protein n=1 Tax=Panicum hallii var. hallii TaxID=1504633 RepID=A0A2T7EYP4_9POAL|nr:hypothetical protein GQ55_2G436600 [Panicum hallii var. hallii]
MVSGRSANMLLLTVLVFSIASLSLALANGGDLQLAILLAELKDHGYLRHGGRAVFLGDAASWLPFLERNHIAPVSSVQLRAIPDGSVDFVVRHGDGVEFGLLDRVLKVGGVAAVFAASESALQLPDSYRVVCAPRSENEGALAFAAEKNGASTGSGSRGGGRSGRPRGRPPRAPAEAARRTAAAPKVPPGADRRLAGRVPTPGVHRHHAGSRRRRGVVVQEALPEGEARVRERAPHDRRGRAEHGGGRGDRGLAGREHEGGGLRGGEGRRGSGRGDAPAGRRRRAPRRRALLGLRGGRRRHQQFGAATLLGTGNAWPFTDAYEIRASPCTVHQWWSGMLK